MYNQTNFEAKTKIDRTVNNQSIRSKDDGYVIASDGRRMKYSEWLAERKAEMDW